MATQLPVLLVFVIVLALLTLAVFMLVTSLAANIRTALKEQVDRLRAEHARKLSDVMVTVDRSLKAAVKGNGIGPGATGAGPDGAGRAELARIIEMAEAQRNQIDEVTRELRELAERPGPQIWGLQDALERRLAEIQEENNRRFDEMHSTVADSLKVPIESATAADGEAGIALGRLQETLLARLEERVRAGREEAGAELTRLQAALSAELSEAARAQCERQDALADRLAALAERSESATRGVVEPRLNSLGNELRLKLDELGQKVTESRRSTTDEAAGRQELNRALNQVQESLLTRLSVATQEQAGRIDRIAGEIQRLAELNEAARVQSERQDALAAGLAALAERSESATREAVEPGLNALGAELGRKLAEFRQEVGESFRSTNDGAAGRQELSHALNELQESLFTRLSAATQEQAGQIDRIAGELHRLAERPEVRVQELRDAVDQRLTRLESESDRKLDELSARLGEESKAVVHAMQHDRATRTLSDGLTESLLARIAELAEAQKDRSEFEDRQDALFGPRARRIPAAS